MKALPFAPQWSQGSWILRGSRASCYTAPVASGLSALRARVSAIHLVD